MESPNEVQSDPKAQAEELKKKGNEAFAGKNYESAIQIYGEALRLDADNAVLYSNRSACYASLKDWQKAFDDAVQAVAKDPKFIKGYFRLSTAQTELNQYDDAETTLKAALQLEPDNELIHKQLKALKAKRTQAAAPKSRKGPRKLDEAQARELSELQEQLGQQHRDLRALKLKLSSLQRDARVSGVTLQQMQQLEAGVSTYRAVGKAFVLTPKEDVEARLERDVSESTRAQRDLTDRQAYLERRIASATQNLTDLYQQ